MRILHTADWHIGQLFHEYDRSYEHQQFLDWLLETIKQEKIDVLLISGDVFDISNPAASSVKMFYTFLNQAVKVNPMIQIIITAGNHDSASRLESPKPLLESSLSQNIHVQCGSHQHLFADHDSVINEATRNKKTTKATFVYENDLTFS